MAIDTETKTTLKALLLILVQDMDKDIDRTAELLGKPAGPGENTCMQVFALDFLNTKTQPGRIPIKTSLEWRLGMAKSLQLFVLFNLSEHCKNKTKFMMLYRLLSIANQVIGMVQAGYGTKQIDSRLRSEWAKIRHSEAYALRQEVIDYWKQNVSPKLSNEKAATQLERIFPISHRKLSEYVSCAKKELRSASKA